MGGRRREIDELRTELAHDPDGLRRRALECICDVAGANWGFWYEYGQLDDVVIPMRWMSRGQEDLTQLVFGRWATERLQWGHADPRAMPASWLGRFRRTSKVIVDPERTYFPTSFYQRVIEPAGISDQLRLIVEHRGVLIAWIGAIRSRGEPHFTRADERRVAPLAKLFADCMVHARATEHAATPEEGCDLVLDPTGGIELTSAAGRVIADGEDAADEIARWVRNVDRGERPSPVLCGMVVRWSRLYARGQVRYLIHFELPTDVKLAPSLSPTQRRVARLASAGLCASEIGAQLTIRESTVRAHLKAVYQRLDVSSRAELARALLGSAD